MMVLFSSEVELSSCLDFFPFFLFYYIFQHQCYIHPVLTGCQVFTVALTKQWWNLNLKENLNCSSRQSILQSSFARVTFLFLLCSESRLEKNNLSLDFEIQCLYHCLGSGWEMCRPINKVEQSSTSLKRTALYFLSLLCFFPINHQRIHDSIEKMILEWHEGE